MDQTNEIRDFGTNYIAQGIAFAVNTAFGIVIFRNVTALLGPELYGKYALYGVAINVAGMLALAWPSNAFLLFGREEFSRTDKFSSTSGNHILLVCLTCGLLSLSIFAGRHRLANYIGLSVASSYMVMAFLLLSLASQFVIVSLKITGRFRRLALLSTLQNAIFLILLYSFIANYPSAEKIIFFSLVAQGCVLLPLAVAVPWSMILPLRLDLGNSGRMLAFSSASFLWMFCYTAIDSIDLVAIKTFLPISYVGTYNAAYRIMSYVWMIPQLTITLTGMLIIGFASKGRDDLIKLYATRYSRHGVFGVALITTVVIGMSREIFWVMLKPEYHSGLVPFIILMVSVSERSVDAFLSPIINAYLLLKKTSVVIIMMAVFNVAGDWLTLKLGMGIMGPAIVTACVFLINGLGLTWIAGRRVGSSLGSHMLFALYPILSIPVALVTGIGYRVTMLCALIGILIGLAKKFRVFDVSDMVLYEKIALPFFFKKGLFRFFHIMA